MNTDHENSTVVKPQINEVGGSARGRPGTLYWPMLVVGVVALALRLAPLLYHGLGWALAHNDSLRYVELAKGLQSGCGFARLIDGNCAPPEVLRTPGYPVFLLAMRSLRTALIFQAILGASLCVFVGYFVSVWWGEPAALIAEVFLALDAVTIIKGSQILSDSLFQTILAVAVIAQLGVIARGRLDRKAIVTLFGASFLLAAAIMVRPVGILLPFLAPLPFFFLPRKNWTKTLGCILLAIAIPTLSLLAWMARNAAETGVWTISTDVALDLYYYKAGGIVWYRESKPFTVVMDELARRIGRPSANDFEDTPVGLTPRMTRDALKILLDHPLATIIMTLRTFIWLAIVPERAGLNILIGANAGATSYYAASGQILARIRELFKSPLLTALVCLQFFLNLLLWTGVARTVLLWRRSSAREIALEIIPFAIAIAMIALASGAEAYARYRMPAAPLLAILAGIGWAGARLRSGENAAQTAMARRATGR
jgi:4-amino-4-deoxy-L-arabinose transferase-like glycosyltransferase